VPLVLKRAAATNRPFLAMRTALSFEAGLAFGDFGVLDTQMRKLLVRTPFKPPISVEIVPL